MSKPLVHKVCHFLRAEIEIATGEHTRCRDCELNVESPYGRGTLGCVLRAQQLIALVRESVIEVHSRAAAGAGSGSFAGTPALDLPGPPQGSTSETLREGSPETPAKSYTVEEAWRIALTLANNLCVQESDRLNRDDGPPEAMHALGEAARRIRDWMEPGEKLTELLAEGTGRMPGVAAETIAPTRVTSVMDFRVTVCSECLCACCWLGEFYCDDYKEASTVLKTVRELKALGPKEDPGFWFKSANTGKITQKFLDAYYAAVADSQLKATGEPA